MCMWKKVRDLFFFSFYFSFPCLCYGYIAVVTNTYHTFGTMSACALISRRSQAFFRLKFQLFESSHVNLTTNDLQLTTINLQIKTF
jgi:hypothetical protein